MTQHGDGRGRDELVWQYEGGPVLEVIRHTDEQRTVHWLTVQHGVPGVVVIPRDEDRLLLLRQFRAATGRSHVQFPRGFGEDGERPIDSAQRELLEETGLAASEVRLLGEFYLDPGLLSGRVAVVLARVRVPETLTPLSRDEQISEFVPATRSQLRALARAGELDGITLAALSLYDVTESCE